MGQGSIVETLRNQINDGEQCVSRIATYFFSICSILSRKDHHSVVFVPLSFLWATKFFCAVVRIDIPSMSLIVFCFLLGEPPGEPPFCSEDCPEDALFIPVASLAAGLLGILDEDLPTWSANASTMQLTSFSMLSRDPGPPSNCLFTIASPR